LIFAKRALLGDGWVHNVQLTIVDGAIKTVTPDATPAADDTRVDTLLPALSNLHSHSFQRAMAGMTEYRVKGRDSFWTWRDLMYRFVNQLTPQQMEDIAALVFMEMQEAGYAAVGEFHYVHHQPDGKLYTNLAELSERIYAAASLTGIGLTHLPVLYSFGGAGQKTLSEGQRRFGNDLDRFSKLVAKARAGLSSLPGDARIGIAPHSLRAVSPESLAALIAQNADGPLHMHIAEQPQEVTDIHAWLGARPVEWLLDHADVNERWCLIHATHMTEVETRGLAQTRAVVGLCPITEANLGDGPFNGSTYLSANGRFGIGSDSNVNISLTEELRTLEYSQRLRDLARNVMVLENGSVGQTLYVSAAQGGAQALDRKAGQIAVGCLADLVAIDTQTPALCALNVDQLLNGFVFAAKGDEVTDVWSAGRHMVKNGRHLKRDEIVGRYKKAVAGLLN
jgi:formimidoylglutamate deiminase